MQRLGCWGAPWKRCRRLAGPGHGPAHALPRGRNLDPPPGPWSGGRRCGAHGGATSRY